MKRYQQIGCSLVLILAFIIGSAAPVAAWDQRYQERQKRPAHQTQKRHAPACHTPKRHLPVVVKDRTYFYLDGIFYRSGLNGYIAVQAPLGAIVVSLPTGSHDIVVGGSKYYVYGGVYYRNVPLGYEVVRKPYLGDAYCRTDYEYRDQEQVMVIPRILNVRQGPGKSHPIIHKVYRDDILKVIGRAPGWVYVNLPYGEFGWIMTEYVVPVGLSAKG